MGAVTHGHRQGTNEGAWTKRQKTPAAAGMLSRWMPEKWRLLGDCAHGVENRWSGSVSVPSRLDATRPWRVEGNLHPASLRVNCGEHRHRPVRAHTPRQRRACSAVGRPGTNVLGGLRTGVKRWLGAICVPLDNRARTFGGRGTDNPKQTGCGFGVAAGKSQMP